MFIIGAGRVGKAIIKKCLPQQKIYYSNRAINQLDAAWRCTPLAVDLDQNLNSSHLNIKLPNAANWLYLVPPATQPKRNHDARIDNLFALLSRFALQETARPQRILLVSSSAVYGDYQGAWVDETAATKATSERGKLRLRQEKTMRKLCADFKIELIIIRPGAIIDDANLDISQLANNVYIHAAQCPVFNYVDVNFLAEACLVLLKKAPAGIYNIADRPPISATARANMLLRQQGLAAASTISYQQAKRQFSPARFSFYSESKRLDSSKIKRYLKTN